MTDQQELKALEYINDALDEIGIPRDTGITRQTFTTWGRVSILIERYNQLKNHLNKLESPAPDGRQWDEPTAEEVRAYWAHDDSMTIRFSGGAVDYSDQPETVSNEDEFLF